MRLSFIVVLLLITVAAIFPQSAVQWFPSDLNIQPFTANFIEPKAGVHFAPGIEKLRLDIGTSSDIYHSYSDETTISFGADLFTYTRLISRSDFKFPVETVDYLFGINFGYNKDDGKKSIGFRIRISHISAHLVDGAYDDNKQEWRDGRTPITFSKEFIELFPFYRVGGMRVYIGLTYIFHILPSTIGKGIYQAGFDYYANRLATDIFTPFIAYDFKLSSIDGNYTGNNIISGGIKFGQFDKKGLSIIYSFLAGKSIHGEYYKLNENYSSIGINMDL